MIEPSKGQESGAQINWRLVLGEGLVSLVFSLALAAAASTVAYMMFASLAEQGQGQVFTMTYLEAAPRLAAVVYVVFFLLSMLALTRFRIHGRVSSRWRVHWALAFGIFSVIGIPLGLVFWLMLSAADRPGI